MELPQTEGRAGFRKINGSVRVKFGSRERIMEVSLSSLCPFTLYATFVNFFENSDERTQGDERDLSSGKYSGLGRLEGYKYLENRKHDEEHVASYKTKGH